jgi:BspA type Leucine rich repeat region (6 copies)
VFSDCESLTSVTISNGIVSIGDRAFRGCSSLTSIAIRSADFRDPQWKDHPARFYRLRMP